MHLTFPKFTTNEIDSLAVCNIITLFFNCLWGGKFLISLGGLSENTGKH